MPARSLTALAAALALAAFTLRADEPQAQPVAAKENAQPPDAVAALLDKLHGDEILIEGNVNDIPHFEMLQKLSARHQISFVINEEAFRAEGVNDPKDKKPNLSVTQPLRGQTLHQFLTTALNSMGATYMVKGKVIEIVPPAFAARATKAGLHEVGEGRRLLAQPLVSAVVKEKPLNEALAQIAERYDLTVVVSPQAGDAKMGFVTARLLNVPADQAIELLAVQHDLRVVRKGNAFLVTSREHADGLFAEQLEKERARIELEKFRAMPVGPPGPEPAPQPKPGPQLLPGGNFELKLNVVPPKPKE